jgi:hypothetical protein
MPFVKLKNLLTYSQHPATGHYPGAVESNPDSPVLVNITLPSTPRPPNFIFLSDLPTKILFAFLISLMLATCHSHHMLLD